MMWTNCIMHARRNNVGGGDSCDELIDTHHHQRRSKRRRRHTMRLLALISLIERIGLVGTIVLGLLEVILSVSSLYHHNLCFRSTSSYVLFSNTV